MGTETPDGTMVPMMDIVQGETLEEAAERMNVKLIGFNRGGRSFRSETLHVCAVCWHQTEATFEADSDTHRILNRSLEPLRHIGLCVRCWSDLSRDSG